MEGAVDIVGDLDTRTEDDTERGVARWEVRVVTHMETVDQREQPAQSLALTARSYSHQAAHSRYQRPEDALKLSGLANVPVKEEFLEALAPLD